MNQEALLEHVLRKADWTINRQARLTRLSRSRARLVPKRKSSVSRSGRRAVAARDRFNRLRDTYARQLGVGEGGQVHHAIELQVLDRFPGAFSERQLNSLQNMRGIPYELSGKRQLHSSKVREIWDRHYRNLSAEINRRGLQPGTAAYNSFVKRYLSSARDEIDYVAGQFFSEYRLGLPRAFR